MKRRFGESLRVKLAAGVATSLLVLLVGAASYFTVVRASRATSLVAHADEVLLERERLLSTLKDAETGARGYVLTGEETFLDPYYSAVEQVPRSLENLRRLTADHPRQQPRIDTLESVARQSVELNEQIVRFRRRQGFDEAHRLIESGQSKIVMDHARALLAEIESEERTVLAQRTAAQQAARNLALLVIGAGSIIAFLLSLLVNRAIRGDVLEREHQAELIERQAVQLKEQATRLSRQLRESRDLADQLTMTNQHLHAASVATGEARARAEDALRQVTTAEREQARLAKQNAALLESIEQGIYGMDMDGICTFINPSGAKMLGYSPAELIGKQIHAAVHYKRPDGSPYPLAECPLFAAMQQGRGIHVANEVMWRKDATMIPVEYTLAPLVEGGELRGSVVAITDISERMRAERALRESEERKGAVLRSTLDSIIAMDSDGRITEFNRAAEEAFGRRREDVIGRSLAETIIPYRFRKGHRDGLERHLRTGEARVIGKRLELPAMRADGGEFIAEIAITRTEIDGRPYFTGVVRDISDRKRAESEREQLIRALARSNQELDQFAYVASHDLKAPLRGIANLSQWIEEDLGVALDGEGKAQMELLRGRVHRMEALIDGILQYSRAGRTRAKPELVDTGALVRDIIELMSPPARTKINVQPGMPTVQSERVPLQQVFLNLIGNAVKHAGRPDAEIEIGWRDDDTMVEFAVQDNGQGIAPQFHERIFGIFQTLEARDKVEGAGIGLSVVKKIVEAKQGRVWVESEPGKGATFRFEWPKREIMGE
ncbi:MAG TPA: PAS domain S-box protein [Gemmatimonadaceae bacterium]